MKNVKTLFLDSAGVPISVIDWTKSILLVMNEKVIVLDWYDIYARSPSTRFQIPSVVMTKKYVTKKNSKLKCTKENIFAREKAKCAYCGELVLKSKRTIDHIVPRCKGGKTSWKNCVLSCKTCNNKKGSSSLQDSGMKLLIEPYEPKTIDRRFLPWFINSNTIPESWKQYVKAQE